MKKLNNKKADWLSSFWWWLRMATVLLHLAHGGTTASANPPSSTNNADDKGARRRRSLQDISNVKIYVYDCEGLGGDNDNDQLMQSLHPYCFYEGDYTNPANLTAKPPLIASRYKGVIDNEILDPTAIAAYNNLRIVLDYLWQKHGIDSWDGKGGDVATGIHLGPSSGDAAVNDAAYLGYFSSIIFPLVSLQNIMVFGSSSEGTSWATALDLVAHEFSRGLYWATAMDYFPFPYQPAATVEQRHSYYTGEPQAVNVHYADVLAAMVDKYANKSEEAIWSIGEDLFDGNDGVALRYMNNPALTDQSDWYPERALDDDDSVGAYQIAGIGNLAFYLLSEGGTHPNATKAGWANNNTEVVGIGTENAAIIWFNALQYCLQPGSKFPQLRYCTEHVAAMSGEFQQNVANAWEVVGLTESEAPEDFDPNVTIYYWNAQQNNNDAESGAANNGDISDVDTAGADSEGDMVAGGEISTENTTTTATTTTTTTNTADDSNNNRDNDRNIFATGATNLFNCPEDTYCSRWSDGCNNCEVSSPQQTVATCVEPVVSCPCYEQNNCVPVCWDNSRCLPVDESGGYNHEKLWLVAAVVGLLGYSLV